MTPPFLMPVLRRGIIALALMTSMTAALSAQATLYRSDAFVVTDSSVRQGRFEAVATSRDTILSSYPRAAREVHYKFSINSQENEFRPGTEHTLFVRPEQGAIVTPLHVFGVRPPPPVPTPEESAAGEEGTAQITFRVDMREVTRSFREQGYYDPPNGPRIRREEFQAVYVIGDTDPLTWDRSSLRPGARQQMTDADGDGIYTVTLPVVAEYNRPLGPDGRAIWARKLDLAGFPELTSPQRLLDALYRMSLEELRQLVRPDGALSAGAKWPGVWTRDVSLSSVLALALVVPDAVQVSLMAKVDSAGRIIQDTGTGGSWPVSTDRMTWAMAAWELYAATGDRAWLRTAYDIIRRSAEADLHAARDPATGLFRGESSFLDWREQSYPRWMDPKDIYGSEALGTNAVHYAAYRILADMARALGEPAERWGAVADTVRRGMTKHLWQADRGWYAQYRYGRAYPALSPRAEGLGEALSVIYGATTADRRATLMRRAPLVAFGTPTFWPYIPGEPLYHNGTIWPFVTAYWTWAAADAGSTAAVEHGLASMTRSAALFLTNKENMVAATGHFEGTALNSDRQLWSVAGTLASTYRLLFGMRLHPERLEFRPMVPPAYGGERTLRGLRYRGAVLTVTVRGSGTGVASARLDGRAVARAEIPASLAGEHALEIEMNGRWPASGAGAVNLVENRFAPATPVAALRADSLRGDTLAWAPVAGAVRYIVHRNGRPVTTTTGTHARVTRGDALAEYQVLAEDSGNVASFLSEPVRVVASASVLIARPPASGLEREHAGFTGEGYLLLMRERNTTVDIPILVERAGVYAVDVRYANGGGPVNSDSKGAVRTLRVDGRPAGVLVMPQRGTDLWTDWGYSNALRVRLSAGAHTLRIAYTPLDENMHRAVNTALLDHIRLTRLSAGR
ncbi:MAG: hypothetical protein WKG32_21820 [Gemmatimonadaceae bacterium]